MVSKTAVRFFFAYIPGHQDFLVLVPHTKDCSLHKIHHSPLFPQLRVLGEIVLLQRSPKSCDLIGKAPEVNYCRASLCGLLKWILAAGNGRGRYLLPA